MSQPGHPTMYRTHNTLSEDIRARSIELLDKHLVAAIGLQLQFVESHIAPK
jgi:hypothetical protein